MQCGTCSLFICPKQIPHTVRPDYSGHSETKSAGEKFRLVLFRVYKKYIKNPKRNLFLLLISVSPTALSNRNRIDRISSFVIYESKVIFPYLRFFIKKQSEDGRGNQILSPSGVHEKIIYWELLQPGERWFICISRENGRESEVEAEGKVTWDFWWDFWCNFAPWLTKYEGN